MSRFQKFKDTMGWILGFAGLYVINILCLLAFLQLLEHHEEINPTNMAGWTIVLILTTTMLFVYGRKVQ